MDRKQLSRTTNARLCIPASLLLVLLLYPIKKNFSVTLLPKRGEKKNFFIMYFPQKSILKIINEIRVRMKIVGNDSNIITDDEALLKLNQ